jgi:RNA polymerase sigma factor (sigma-70 family)
MKTSQTNKASKATSSKGSVRITYKTSTTKKHKFQEMTLSNHFPQITRRDVETMENPSTESANQKSQRDQSAQILASSMLAIKAAAAKAMAIAGAERYGITAEDLVSVGTITALEAISRYDATKASFLGFALRRIQGSMVDYIRDNCPIPRSQTAKLKNRFDLDLEEVKIANHEAVQSTENMSVANSSVAPKKARRSLTESNMAAALGALYPISLDAATESTDNILNHDIIGTDSLMFSSDLSDVDKLALKEVIELMSIGASTSDYNTQYSITANERNILDLHLSGYTQDEISEKMGVTGSRISQSLKQVTEKMSSFVKLDGHFTAKRRMAKAS